MPSRPVSYDYSEVADFSAKSVLSYTYAATPTYSIDGTPTGPVTDLGSLKATIAEFETDDADGAADPTERVLATAGGTVLTRSADGATLQIGIRPAVPFARAVALRELLAALGY